MNTEDVERRLDAIKDVDWRAVEWEKEEEYFGDWVRVGPVLMHDFDPEDEHEQHRESARVEKRQQTAVIEFLTHAADDMRSLLLEVDRLLALVNGE